MIRQYPLTTPEIWASGPHTVYWAKDTGSAYVLIAAALTTDVLFQFAHPFRDFHTLTVYRRTETEGCTGASSTGAKDGSASQPVTEPPCEFTAQGVEYLTTIMLLTAFATTLTMIACRGLAQSIMSARKFFVWLYDHPNVVVGCWIACWPLCFFLGEIIVQMFVKARS